MPTNHPSKDASEAASKLDDSLKSCHKVLRDYREVLLKTPESSLAPPKGD